MHAFSTTLRRLRARTEHSYPAGPVTRLLPVGKAINHPLLLPEALEALSTRTLPDDPELIRTGGQYAINPSSGEIATLRPGAAVPAGFLPLRDQQWCLLRCEKHGWEDMGALQPVTPLVRTVLLELGVVLASQGCPTCEELDMKTEVFEKALLPSVFTTTMTSSKCVAGVHAGDLTKSPLAALQACRAAAGALSKTLTDLGYVVARALEALADL